MLFRSVEVLSAESHDGHSGLQAHCPDQARTGSAALKLAHCGHRSIGHDHRRTNALAVLRDGMIRSVAASVVRGGLMVLLAINMDPIADHPQGVCDWDAAGVLR